jgi:PilZ domain
MASKVAPSISRDDQADIDKRRAPRLPVVISRATLRRSDSALTDAVVHDLSIYGCRVMSGMKLHEGDALTLRFAGSTPVTAKVVWSDGIFTGCRFDVPIANSVFRAFTLSGFERPVRPAAPARAERYDDGDTDPTPDASAIETSAPAATAAQEC